MGLWTASPALEIFLNNQKQVPLQIKATPDPRAWYAYQITRFGKIWLTNRPRPSVKLSLVWATEQSNKYDILLDSGHHLAANGMITFEGSTEMSRTPSTTPSSYVQTYLRAGVVMDMRKQNDLNLQRHGLQVTCHCQSWHLYNSRSPTCKEGRQTDPNYAPSVVPKRVFHVKVLTISNTYYPN